MSAHCDTCGTDLVYPEGMWPLGVCQVCELRAERDRLREALETILADLPASAACGLVAYEALHPEEER